MSNVEFENILDTCIAEVCFGQATVEDCLQQHAVHVPVLKPLLCEAASLITLPRVTMPTDAIDALEQRMLSQAAQISATLSPKE
jgi:DNA-binding IclR family transcriptional regulator